MELKELTKAEEEVMQYLWRRGKAFVKDLLTDFPEPKPAYNTVSTIVRILEQKGFVGHTAYGKTHEYEPRVSREAYKEFIMKNMVEDYFSGSFKNMVSFFAAREEMTTDELNAILNEIKKHRKS